jgi:hypothetical protein
VIALVAAATSAPLWRPLFVYGHSIDLDPFRQVAFDAALRAGDLFPRWTPYWYYGYGSPLFHFYAPLPYFISELWLLAGASLARAFQLTLFVGWLASGFAMYLLARDSFSRAAATAVAVLYLLAPYHLVDMLVRHALGEHLAFVWIPLAIWGVAGTVSRPGAQGREAAAQRAEGERRWTPAKTRFAIGALALAALPLTHNLTALLALPVVIAWTALAWVRTRHRAGLARAAAATALGLGLSAFFWLPAIADLGAVSARERLTSEFFRFSLHFVHPTQLFSPAWGFGGSRPGVEDDGLSFQIGLLHWALAAAAAAALAQRVLRAGGLGRDPATWTALAALAVFAGAALMTTAISEPLWNALPWLALAQFPWRFLTLAAFGASLASGFAIDALFSPERRAARPLAAAAVVVCALLVYGRYAQPQFAVYDRERNDYLHAPYAEARALLADPARHQEVAARADLATLIETGQSGTSRHEYIPRAVTRLPTKPPERRAEVLGSGRVEGEETLGPNHERFTVAMDAAGELRFHQFYFAGWRAAIDGKPASLASERASGAILVPVPAGRHAVEIEFGSTPLRRVANATSALALLLLVMAAARLRPSV